MMGFYQTERRDVHNLIKQSKTFEASSRYTKADSCPTGKAEVWSRGEKIFKNIK